MGGTSKGGGAAAAATDLVSRGWIVACCKCLRTGTRVLWESLGLGLTSFVCLGDVCPVAPPA
jgi:hypothetical protein